MEGIRRYGQALGGSPTPFEEEVEKHLSGQAAQERDYKKMHAAQTGGSPGLGPEEEAQALAKRQQTLQQQTEVAGQRQAAQARAHQTTPTPPPAPSGPQGVTQPYPAKAGREEEEG
jgi:hypothetical protein